MVKISYIHCKNDKTVPTTVYCQVTTQKAAVIHANCKIDHTLIGGDFLVNSEINFHDAKHAY